MPKLEKGSGQLELTFFGYRDYMNHEAAVKAIPGRRFQNEGERKFWAFPEDPQVAERLMVTVKPEVSADLLGWVKVAKAAKQAELVTPLPNDADLLIPWGSKRVAWQPEEVGKRDDRKPFTSLYAYQRAFVSFASEHPRVLLADDMGLGKCGQSLSAVYEYMLSKSKLAIEPDSIPTDGLSCAADMLKWAGVDDGPKLIICPNSVKGTWAREIKMWLGEDEPVLLVDTTYGRRKATEEDHRLLGHKPNEEGEYPSHVKPDEARTVAILKAAANNAWIIVNWEQIRTTKKLVKKRQKMVHPLTREFIRWKDVQKEVVMLKDPAFESIDWLAAIADEAHRAKNRKALVTQGLLRIDAEIKLAMTGTPLMNSPEELWPLLKWLFPEEYTAFWRFHDQYVEFYEGQYGKIVTGVKNVDALRFELSTRLVRRTKDQVLDLPEKTRVYVPVKLGTKQQKLYDEAEREMWFEVEQAIKAGDKSAEKFAAAVAENPGAIYTVPNGAARTVRLRQIASTPALLGGEDVSAKLDAAVEIITDAQPKQIVFFTEFVGTADIMAERLKAKGLRAEVFTGKTDTIDRTRLENEFQNGDIDVLCGTIDAMKEGLTLTAADTQVWTERKWTPAPNEQGEDRSHRNGQDKPVTIIILEAEGTVDVSKVRPTNQIKSMIVGSVITKDEVTERDK